MIDCNVCNVRLYEMYVMYVMYDCMRVSIVRLLTRSLFGRQSTIVQSHTSALELRFRLKFEI